MSRWSFRTSRRSWRRSWRSAGTSPVAGAWASVNIEANDTKISVNRLRRIVFLLWGLSTFLVPKTVLRLGDGREAFSPYAGGNTDSQEKFRGKIWTSEATLGARESGEW